MRPVGCVVLRRAPARGPGASCSILHPWVATRRRFASLPVDPSCPTARTPSRHLTRAWCGRSRRHNKRPQADAACVAGSRDQRGRAGAPWGSRHRMRENEQTRPPSPPRLSRQKPCDELVLSDAKPIQDRRRVPLVGCHPIDRLQPRPLRVSSSSSGSRGSASRIGRVKGRTTQACGRAAPPPVLMSVARVVESPSVAESGHDARRASRSHALHPGHRCEHQGSDGEPACNPSEARGLTPTTPRPDAGRP